MALAPEIRIVIKTVKTDELTPQVVDKMTNVGNAVLRRMQRLVPKRTWALHNSMTSTTTYTRDEVRTSVAFGGGSVDYGLYVERGHYTVKGTFVKAQPFARPALMQTTGVDLK